MQNLLVGSNQFQIKRRGFQFKGYREVGVICLLLMPIIYFGNQVAGQKEGKFVSPIPDNAYANTIVAPQRPHNSISEEIDQVFGKDANQAFKLLSCENHALNPSAVNTAGNYPVGSRDIGIFQINEYWQKVNAKFLFNPDINIRMAHQIYEESGNSFKMWSCGRRLGL